MLKSELGDLNLVNFLYSISRVNFSPLDNKESTRFPERHAQLEARRDECPSYVLQLSMTIIKQDVWRYGVNDHVNCAILPIKLLIRDVPAFNSGFSRTVILVCIFKVGVIPIIAFRKRIWRCPKLPSAMQERFR